MSLDSIKSALEFRCPVCGVEPWIRCDVSVGTDSMILFKSRSVGITMAWVGDPALAPMHKARLEMVKEAADATV